MLAKRYDEAFEISPAKPVVQPVPRRKVQLNTRLRSKCLLFLFVVSAMAMVVTLLSGMNASRGYDLVQAKQEAVRIEAENERLRLEVAKLKAPQRIKAIAADQLGMVVSDKVYFASDK